MLDIRFIREHPALVQEGARKKHIDIDVQHLLEVDEQRRSSLPELKASKPCATKPRKKFRPCRVRRGRQLSPT